MTTYPPPLVIVVCERPLIRNAVYFYKSIFHHCWYPINSKVAVQNFLILLSIDNFMWDITLYASPGLYWILEALSPWTYISILKHKEIFASSWKKFWLLTVLLSSVDLLFTFCFWMRKFLTSTFQSLLPLISTVFSLVPAWFENFPPCLVALSKKPKKKSSM